MSRALPDVIVLDLTVEFWASIGVALLADFGAQVIRVERPSQSRPRFGTDDAAWDYRAELADRNKQSVAIDWDQPAGRRILDDLVRKADVVVTDRPAPFLDEHRLDYGSVSALRPDVIYARGSGLGPKGPDRDLPALDELAAARTGMMPILPQPGQPPVYTGSGQMYTSVMLAFGIVAALRHRQETGEGQEVDASLLGGNMYGASLDLQAFLAIGGERFLHPISRMDAGNPMSGTLYRTQDGLWVTLTMPDTDRWWPALAEITGLDAQDERFDSHEKRCEQHRLELIEALERAFLRQPAAHWRAVFTERQLSADVIEEYAYPANDPDAVRNQYIVELDHPPLGSVKSIGFPIHMSESPVLHRPAPAAGEHTAEVLRELLGRPESAIAALMEEGAF